MSKSKSEPSIPWSTRNQSSSTASAASDKDKKQKTLASPSPSASILLVSPSNEVLLLHRVQTSSSFPSAHVFPGGNLEASDGPIAVGDTKPERHQDSTTYRTGGIRELFEETGILLARESSSPDSALLTLPLSTRLHGRKAIHDGSISMQAWLRSHAPNAVLDTEGLLPFTRWITPTNVPKRFTTQMYIYFLPTTSSSASSSPSSSQAKTQSDDLIATSDEVETMAPEWRSAQDWLGRAQSGEIILFPPQFLLLSFVSQFLDPSSAASSSSSTSSPSPEEESQTRRSNLITFITSDGSPPWRDKIICPTALSFTHPSGKTVLGLDKPGPELKEHAASLGLSVKSVTNISNQETTSKVTMGDNTRVVLVNFSKAGPREVQIRMKNEVMQEMKQDRENKL